LLYFVVVSRSAVSYGFMTFLPLQLTRHGYSVTQVGVIASLYLALGALGGFLGGWLAERFGGRRVVIASFLGSAPLYLLFLYLPDSSGLLCLVAGSFVLQASLPVNVVMGQELSPRHASTISSLLMGAAWGLGALIVSPVGALADRWGLHAALLALAAMLVVGLACAILLPAVPARIAAVEVPEAAGG
jgi:FSR family fosmidomycin resistance protein-like MFS transporter